MACSPDQVVIDGDRGSGVTVSFSVAQELRVPHSRNSCVLPPTATSWVLFVARLAPLSAFQIFWTKLFQSTAHASRPWHCRSLANWTSISLTKKSDATNLPGISPTPYRSLTAKFPPNAIRSRDSSRTRISIVYSQRLHPGSRLTLAYVASPSPDPAGWVRWLRAVES